MKTIKYWRIMLMMLAAFSLTSCSSDDDNEDKVEQVTVYVSAMCENSLMPDTVTSACRFMWSVHRPMKIGTGNELPDACFMWQASGKPSTS